MRERDIEAYLVKAAKLNGALSFKWVSPSQRGVPDRIVIFPGGRVTFVELKTSVGVLSKLQRYTIDLLTLFGCEVHVIRSKKDVDNLFS